MACFTKNQQRNGTNCQFEKYVTTSNYFVLNSLDKGHLNSVCTHYVCDKSENARVCAKWQWNALDWYYWIALPASPVVQSSNTVSCVSLSFRTHPCVLAIYSHLMTSLYIKKAIHQIFTTKLTEHLLFASFFFQNTYEIKLKNSPVREITQRSSTFSATNISSNSV